MITLTARDVRSPMFHGAVCNNSNGHNSGWWHAKWANITYPKDPIKSPADALTKFVTDALVLQQRMVFEGIPAVQDPRVPAQCSNAAQRQHRVVYEQRGRLLSEPRQYWAVAAILGVTEDQHFAHILVLA